MRYFLRLAYDGSSFHGWQRQPNAVSVQQRLEEALSTILRHPVDLTGAGRTDTGVHAREMYAHFDSDAPIEAERFLRSLNRMIGSDIAVGRLLPVIPEAHARFDAISRSYSYHIITHKDPFRERYAHRMERLPNLDAMNEAAAILLQTEDFTSFAKLHSDSLTNLCDVSHAQWVAEGDGAIRFDISANRFLRNMVRAVVGTLLEVGTGKLNLDGFKSVIYEKDRCAAGMSVPAKGLFLTRIVYPDNIFLL